MIQMALIGAPAAHRSATEGAVFVVAVLVLATAAVALSWRQHNRSRRKR